MADEIIKQSIKNLIDMKMNDEDIIGSLLDAGVDYEYATEMLNVVKYGKEKGDKSLDMPKKEVQQKPTEGKQKRELNVWEEGVITIIDQKLSEINEKQKRIDEAISNKVNAITDTEIKKLKVLLDSQRTLLISKVNSEMEQKAKLLEDNITSTLKNMQEINKQTTNYLEDIKQKLSALDSLQKTLQEQIKVISEIRDNSSQIIQQAKSDIDSNVGVALKKYEEKFQEVDKKLNSALNIASKILEGLVVATKTKLDDYYIKREAQATNTSATNAAIIPIDDKILARISELEKKVSSNDKIKPVEDSILDLNRRLMDIDKRIKNTDVPKDINSKFEEYDSFIAQYSEIVGKLSKDVKQIKTGK